MKPRLELFDGQAQAFDRRAGFLPAQCRQIATAICDVGHVGEADLIVEVGAGTGQIGIWLAAARPYLGFDLSSGMLQQFHARSRDSAAAPTLVRADANRGWPVVTGAARVIFGSRTLHLLDHEAAADEVFRVARKTGATLVIGRVERQPESLRARLAAEMRRRLRQAGLDPRGDQQHRRLVDACVARGAVPSERVTVVDWSVSTTARQSLDAWRQLPGMGGTEVPDDIRRVVLKELEQWAADTYGGIDRPVESREAYVLGPLRLPSL